MKRTIPTAVAAALVGAGVLLGPAAHAITNPADNPRPITVKGDDGKTYHDGEDTLPGYDDEACTYIPGAWFDFDNNRVRYADGQSIPWTEWDRATGYKEWLAKKSKGSSGSTPSTKPSATPKSSGGTTESSTTKASTTKGSTTKAKTPVASQTQAATPSATATDEAAPVVSADGTKKAGKSGKAGKAKAKAAAATTAESTTEPVEAAEPQTDVVEATAAKSTQDSSSAGLLILGGLGAAGLAVFAGYSVLGRRRKGAAS